MMRRNEKQNVNRKLTDEQIMELHKEHIESYRSIPELAQQCGLTRQNLRKRFVTLGLPHQKRLTKFSGKTVHSYFDRIDTELKAYMIGFIAGDGNIGSVKPYLSIQIQSEDTYVLDWLRLEVAPHVKLLYSTPRSDRHKPLVKLSIYSQPIVTALQRIGLVPRKSFIPFKLNGITKDLWKHVIRGLLDSDGCVSKRRNYGQAVMWFSTSKVLLEQMQEHLAIHGIESYLRSIAKKRTQMYTLRVMRKADIYKLYKYLYNGVEYKLHRKHNIFQTLVTPS